MQKPQPAQLPKTKEELRAAAEALFMEIDAEFGKKKKASAAHTRVKNAEIKPQPISEGKEASRIAMLMGEQNTWKPVGRVAHLVIQTCKCCGGEQEFLGSVLIRHQHRVRGSTWDCLIPEQPSHSTLPSHVEYTRQFVEECPSCIRLGMYVQPVEADSSQLTLFS